MTRIYLAGPMTLTDDRGGAWRDRAIPLLARAQVVALDPRTLEAASMTCEEIVAQDYKSILSADAVIADVSKPSWGTAMEIAFATQHGIPVVGYGSPVRVSPWLRHHTISRHASLEVAIESACALIRARRA